MAPGRAARLGVAPAPSCCEEQGGRKTAFFFFLVGFFSFCTLLSPTPPVPRLPEPRAAGGAERKSYSSNAAAVQTAGLGRGTGGWGGKTRNHACLAFIFKSPSLMFVRAPGAAARAGLGSPGFGPCGLGGAVEGCRMPWPAHPPLSPPPSCAPQKPAGTSGFPPFVRFFLELWKGLPALRLPRGLALHKPLDSGGCRRMECVATEQESQGTRGAEATPARPGDMSVKRMLGDMGHWGHGDVR